MSQRTISQQAIFVERDGWVYYVTNWQKRFTAGGRAKLVRLSPRHFVRYNELKGKGRSPKTIALLLFKKVPLAKAGVAAAMSVVAEAREKSDAREKAVPRERAATVRIAKASDSQTVSVDITLLTHEQILALLQRALNERLPGLRALPLNELRRLYLAVLGIQRRE
jgi:hypothetical protein